MSEILAKNCDLDFRKCFKEELRSLFDRKIFKDFNNLVI